MGKCGGSLKFHSPVNGLSIKWCTYVSDWDARGEKLEALKNMEILKKKNGIEKSWRRRGRTKKDRDGFWAARHLTRIRN